MKTYPYAKHKLLHVDIRYAVKALRSGLLSRGKFTQKLEEALCAYSGSKFAVAVSSGTAALHCAYLALDSVKNTTLFSSPITFASAITSGIFSGLNPYFIDVQSDKPILDSALLQHSLKNNSVVTATGYAGFSYPQKELFSVVKARQSFLIADHSHSLGGKITVENELLPMITTRYCDLSVLSFQAIKLITGGGEGGAVLTDNEELYLCLKAIRSHGMVYSTALQEQKEEGMHYHEMQFPGLNYRITEMQAALCLSQLKRISELVEKRSEIADWYFKFLKDVDSVQLPLVSDTQPAWHLFSVRVNQRNKVARDLQRRGVGTQVHYLPVYKHPWYQKMGYTDGSPCLNAEKYYQTALSLPLYNDLKKRDVEFICEALKKVTA